MYTFNQLTPQTGSRLRGTNYDKKLWNDKVIKYKDNTLFHTFDWNDMIEKTFHTEKMFFKILKDNEQIGLIIGHKKKKGPFMLFGSPMRQTATHFMGILTDKQEELSEIHDSVWSYLKEKEKINYLEFNYKKNFGFNNKGDWHVKMPKTFIVNLKKTEDKLLASFEKRARTAIRKAKKNKVQIRKTLRPTKQQIDHFYEMMKQSHGKSNIEPIFPLKFYYNLFSEENKNAYLYEAVYNENVISGALILVYNDWMNYHSAGSILKYRNLNANNLLQWQVMTDGIENRVPKYDLGAGSGIESLDKFKLSFAPRQEQYLSLYKATKIALIGRWIYQKAVPYLRRK
jgi:hypothetical protein